MMITSLQLPHRYILNQLKGGGLMVANFNWPSLWWRVARVGFELTICTATNERETASANLLHLLDDGD